MRPLLVEKFQQMEEQEEQEERRSSVCSKIIDNIQ